MAVRGRLLDLNVSPDGEGIELWLREEDGSVRSHAVRWRPSIYVTGPESELERLARAFERSEMVEVREDPGGRPVRALRIRVGFGERREVATRIEELGGYRSLRVHNVDVPVLQQFLYENGVFPTALVELDPRSGSLRALDSREDLEYDVGWIRTAQLEVFPEAGGRVPSFDDRLREVRVVACGEEAVLDGDEVSVLEGLAGLLARWDPDVLLVRGGDQFVMRYLLHRARCIGMKLEMGRAPSRNRPGPPEVYWSYGRVYRRHRPFRLRGRVHVDPENSFTFAHTGLHGVIEVARTCVVPLHDAARYTIGQCMTSLQYEVAHRWGVLVPSKPTRTLYLRLSDLLLMDRGGLTLDHRPGVYWNVAELDFQSMYPMIMTRFNVSAETVNCSCCATDGIPIPEMGGHTCRRNRGLVPEAIGLPLRKRLAYKRLIRSLGPADSAVYKARADALKWVLVSSFGYLGFRKAKFGSRLAHMAVCAHARAALLRAVRVAEENGFEVVHGIVDSLWVRREGATEEDYARLAAEVEEATGLPVNLEGVYRWIAFLPSRTDRMRPVNGRYFGVTIDGRVKCRGIEARRRDTPDLVREMQLEMLGRLARARSPEELRDAALDCIGLLRRYVAQLVLGRVDPERLVLTRVLSRDPGAYRVRSQTALAARSLAALGAEVGAGSAVRYVITPSGPLPYPHFRPHDFSSTAYVGLLVRAADTLLSVVLGPSSLPKFMCFS
ncbi:MAG: DNA polymerase domain-containing protein [Nitrososphaerota archaeon]|nr:hypothetical protein [Candidatus Calditenuis fumarioli]